MKGKFHRKHFFCISEELQIILYIGAAETVKISFFNTILKCEGCEGLLPKLANTASPGNEKRSFV